MSQSTHATDGSRWQVPNADPGIGENGHCKEHLGQMAEGWYGASIRKARRAHFIPVKGA